MHASQLVELSAILAAQHQAICSQSVDLDFWEAPRFWTLSKSRLLQWAEAIKQCQHLNRDRGPRELTEANAQQFWSQAEPILEEIFLAEVCARVWCATLSALDEQRFVGELDPIARSVFVGQLEARRRALRLLLFARGLRGVPTTGVNRLRRDCELWADVLIANLTPQHIARQYAFDKRRVAQLKTHGHAATSKYMSQQWSNQLVALHFSLAPRMAKPAACAELNEQIGAVLLGCLPADAFDPMGVPRPGWYQAPFQSDQLSVDVLGDLLGSRPRRIRNRFLSGLQDRL